MQFGSDNIVLKTAWVQIYDQIEKGVSLFGSNGFTCIERTKRKAIKIKFENVISGVCRFISKDILLRVAQKGSLYPKEENSGLDTFSQNIIFYCSGQNPQIIDLSDCILDIKTNENINDFDLYEFSSLSSKANFNETIKRFGL